MPPTDKHVQSSIDRTGKPFTEVHTWVNDDESKRAERHDITKSVEHLQYVRSTWGEEAGQEFIIHLQEDIQSGMARLQENLAKQVAQTLAYYGIK